MEESTTIIIQATGAYALAVGGGWLSTLGRFSHERLCGMISLAAGTLLGVTLFNILPESAEMIQWWKLAFAVVSGYAVFFLVSRYVYHVCPACAASHFDESTTHRFAEIATALIIALSIHSTMDGVAVAVGHNAYPGAESSNRVLDWSLLLAICIHKIPEGLALGALLLGTGMRRATTIGWVAVVEATTLLGAVIGIFFLHDLPPQWLWFVLAHVGGGFLYLAAHAVLGEMLKHGRVLVTKNFLLGLTLIGVLHFALRAL